MNRKFLHYEFSESVMTTMESLDRMYAHAEFGYVLLSKDLIYLHCNKKGNSFIDQFSLILHDNFVHHPVMSKAYEAVFLRRESIHIESDELFVNFYFSPLFEGDDVIAMSLIMTERLVNVDAVPLKPFKIPDDYTLELYKLVLDKMPGQVWLMDKSGVIFWQNEATRAYFNLSANQMLSGAWVKKIHPDDVMVSNQAVTESLRTTQANRTQFRVQGPDGNYRLFSSCTTPVLNETGELIYRVGVNFDIEHYQKKLENLSVFKEKYAELKDAHAQEIESLKNELFLAQKLETIGGLAGGIAHDFNNLLLVISMSVELMKIKLGANLIDEEASMILNSVKKGSRLASQLMMFAGKTPNTPKVLDIGNSLGEIEVLLTKVAVNKVKLNLDVEKNLWKVFVDESYFENSILNMVLNARDAVEHSIDPCIEIRMSNFKHNGRLERLQLEPGNYVRIDIIDNGKGIQEADLVKIFDPFFTTKEIGKGTGLGLSMVYGFVKVSNGQILVQSKLDKGTTFTMFLPQARVVQVEENEEVFLDELNFQGTKILVIEDNPDLRNHIVSVLKSFGFICYTSFDAFSALQYINTGLELDLIFSDVMMPGSITSLEFYNILKREGYKVPILYTSGYAENILVKEGKIVDDHHLLMKPYNIHELLVKIKTVLAEVAQD